MKKFLLIPAVLLGSVAVLPHIGGGMILAEGGSYIAGTLATGGFFLWLFSKKGK